MNNNLPSIEQCTLRPPLLLSKKILCQLAMFGTSPALVHPTPILRTPLHCMPQHRYYEVMYDLKSCTSVAQILSKPICVPGDIMGGDRKVEGRNLATQQKLQPMSGVLVPDHHFP
mmetsp:Transcript_32069/g.51814  ORF Transcript_32069/g.51814 Transcript_32069/m.51814 type:complete len:115 (-) Transcript_32069:1204-1548(-)